MSILLDPLPHSAFIGGREVPIQTDFRVSIRYELLMQTPPESEAALLEQVFALYFAEAFELHSEAELQDAMNAIAWFYRCGEAETEKAGSGKKAAEIYSFEYDGPYIYAAFLDQYGIDLTKDDLHWWQFRALFRSLREENEIAKIMSIRGAEFTKDMSREQRASLRKMKQVYRLPDMRTAEQKEADFANAMAYVF